MCRFLRFIVEKTLDGHSADLKEYLLGVEVFDRPDSYDQRIDPIVRVEARRLRAKLDSYYAGDGKGAALRIELPKGSYVPRFAEGSRVSRQELADSRSVAVLPLANAGGDPAMEFFAHGLTQELIHALTQVSGLRVVAWSSAAQVSATVADVYTTGKQLQVETILTGSVRSSESRLRILAQLVDTRTGVYLWSQSFDRDMCDLFVIQQEMAQAIGRALEVKLTGVPPPKEYNLQAYTAYLKGRYEWSKRTPEGFQRAIPAFEQAIAIDPQFALPYAGLADTFTLLADYGWTEPSTVIEKARAAALRALALDPGIAEAEASLGLIKGLHDWNWAEAERHYLRAIELNPGYATSFHWYSLDHLALLGRFDEALVNIERAIQLDPLSPNMWEGKGYIHMLMRDYETAKSTYQHVFTIDPKFYRTYASLARVHIQQGKYHEAIVILEKVRSWLGDLPGVLGALGQAYAESGDRETALGMLRRLKEMEATRYVPKSTAAVVCIGLRDWDGALTLMEEAFDQRGMPLPAIGVHPLYDPLRGEPRFRALLEKTGVQGPASRV